MSNKKLVLIGAGEQALLANEYFTHDSDYDVVAFSVERQYLNEPMLEGKPVVPYEELEQRYPASAYSAFVAIPSSQLNRLRKRFYLELKGKGYHLPSYVSSKAFAWRNVKIGENSFIFENNVLQPYVEVGNNVILWSGNHVGHRTIIRDHVFIASHAVISGYCDIGEGSYLGVNCTLNDGIKIAPSCLIGSGALIVKDTEPEKIYIGSPGKPMPGKSSFDVKT